MSDDLHTEGAGKPEPKPTQSPELTEAERRAKQRTDALAAARRGKVKAAAARQALADKRAAAKEAVKPAAPLVRAGDFADDPIGGPLVERFTRPVTNELELAELLADLFAVPEMLLDESYGLAYPPTLPDGETPHPKAGKPNPRALLAARRLFPLCRKYDLLDKLPLYIPEMLAVAGVVGLLKPCVKPTWEIITGKRDPLIWRGMASDTPPEELLKRGVEGALQAAQLDTPVPPKNGAGPHPTPPELS